MNEFWRRTIRERRKLRSCFHRNSIHQDQQIHVPCFQTSEKQSFTSRTNNRYAVLANEAPAPRADELRRQLEQMQHQIRGIHRQLDNQGEERSRFYDRYPRHVRQNLAPRHGSPSTSVRYHTTAPAPSHRGYQGRCYPAPETRSYKPQWRVKVPSRDLDSASRGSQQLVSSSQRNGIMATRVEQPLPARSAPLSNMAPRVPYASTINQRKRERRRRADRKSVV